LNGEEMSKRVYFGMRILLYVLILIFATALVSVSAAAEEAFDLYNFLNERVDIYNENVGVLQENPFSNALIKIFGDQRIAVHAEDQTIGLIISEGKVERVTRDELPKTTVDVYTDAKTLREIESVDDFKRAWFEERISTKWRNPLANLIQGLVLFVAHNPETTAATGVAGFSVFSFFFYYTGNLDAMIRKMYPAFLLLTGRRPEALVREEGTKLMRIKYKWKGKGYMMKRESHRLLIGHSYTFSYELEPAGEIKGATIKLRYSKDKLGIDDDIYSTKLPASKIHHVEPKEEGMPELKSEATDFIIIDVVYENGTKEEGVAKIPISINRFIVDSIPYSVGRVITWLSSLQFGGTALIVIVVYKILPIVK
jgi:hypothetical protein